MSVGLLRPGDPSQLLYLETPRAPTLSATSAKEEAPLPAEKGHVAFAKTKTKMIGLLDGEPIRVVAQFFFFSGS